ncbi:MAG: carbohydrate ABC transporter permease [Treponema sp.]|nr:carbohydrate ABC transporter permease [Treponema sp.]
MSTISKPERAVSYLFLSLGALAIIFPIYLTVITAFKTPDEIARNFFLPPGSFYLGNMQYILTRSKFLLYVRNSLFVTVVSVSLIAVFTPMVSYSIARNMDHSRLYKGFYFYFLLAIFVPFQVIMVPLTLMMQKVNLMNHAGLIICYLSLALTQSVFLYTGYIKSIPLELEESSFMDGCNVPQTFFRIIYPLIAPMTATIVILNALWVWNDFLLPLLVLNKSNSFWTMPLFMFNFKNQYSFESNLAFAAFLLALLPVIILYSSMQRYIIAGLTNGALKG